VPKINKRVIIVKELQNERNFISIAKILVSKLRVLYDQQVALCVFLWGCRLCLLCYWLLIDKQMYLIRWVIATLCACCIAYSTQRLLTSVKGSFTLQMLQLVDDSSLYQRHYVMIRLFISKALCNDRLFYMYGTTSCYGCLYQQHYIMILLFILCNVNPNI
jgi:hypothetical protein